jgi:hypothetical protein
MQTYFIPHSVSLLCPGNSTLKKIRSKVSLSEAEQPLHEFSMCIYLLNLYDTLNRRIPYPHLNKSSLENNKHNT